jgi:hypothetical protein
VTGTPPDWTLKFDIRGKTESEFQEIMRGAADDLRQRGSESARATLLPDATRENARTLIIEGWRVRPEQESPLPSDGEVKQP